MVDSKSKTANPSYPPPTVEALVNVLVGVKHLTEEMGKDIVVKQGTQRGRLLKAKRDLVRNLNRPGMVEPTVAPCEIIASFEFASAHDPRRTIDEDLVMESYAGAVKLPFEKVDPLKLDMDMVTRIIPHSFAQRHNMIPIRVEDDALVVAMDDPSNLEGIDFILRASNREVRPLITGRGDIEKLISEFYGFRSSLTAAEKTLTPTFDIGNLEQYVKMKTEGTFEATDEPIVNAVEHLLRYAYDQRASDIHIEPKRETSNVRMRIDGVLHTVHRIPRAIHSAMVSRIKILARMDIAEKRRSQDGRIKTDHKGREIELRISTMPVAFGEKAVIRVFDPEILMQEVSELGFFAGETKLFNEFIHRPHGIICVTGPTGSGKTTTLYSALREVATAERNITTIEDPIEMVCEDFNQVNVQPKIDMTFSNVLRSLLRQDPDIIMVGEIRDRETAENVIQAALTGHLVFTTLHTNDSASAITRLMELDIEPFLISSTLIGVIAQRLVRTICPQCRTERPLTADEQELLGVKLHGEEAPKISFGEGCVACRRTGYQGRVGIFEVMPITQSTKHLIHKRESSATIKKDATDHGMLTLREAGIKKIGQGITTVEEVVRVTAHR